MLQIMRLALQGSSAKGSTSVLQACASSFSLSSAYSTSTPKPANPQDYSIVMKKAAEVSNEIVQPIDKEVGYCTGVPLETFNRQARIYTPAKTASQSGFAKTVHNTASAPAWKIAFETTAKWENPLIGWTSTADPLENVGRASLFFYTKEEAIRFCTKHGWSYTVDEPNMMRRDRQKRFATYGDNYSTKRKGVPDLSHMPSMRTAKK